MEPLTFVPIGVVRSPFVDRASAPRQPDRATLGTIELEPGRGFEHALEDLEAWDRLWVLFVFDRNEGFSPKVLPPRSDKKRGVFATRSPRRPNPIGMSAVELIGVEGLVVRVRGLDILDGTPVLDLKPYVPYADAFPDASSGWLEARDPGPVFEVVFEADALAACVFVRDATGFDLEERVRTILAAGPEPHPYRRIKRAGDELVVAVKAWRAKFRVEGGRVLVRSVATGYRPRELATGAGPEIEVHRRFEATFGQR